jgi:hypothetical protein
MEGDTQDILYPMTSSSRDSSDRPEEPRIKATLHPCLGAASPDHHLAAIPVVASFATLANIWRRGGTLADLHINRYQFTAVAG